MRVNSILISPCMVTNRLPQNIKYQGNFLKLITEKGGGLNSNKGAVVFCATVGNTQKDKLIRPHQLWFAKKHE